MSALLPSGRLLFLRFPSSLCVSLCPLLISFFVFLVVFWLSIFASFLEVSVATMRVLACASMQPSSGSCRLDASPADRRRSIHLGKHPLEAAGGSSSMPSSSRLPSRAPEFEQGVLPADSESSSYVVLLAFPVHVASYNTLHSIISKTTPQVVRQEKKKDASFQAY